MDDRDHYSRTDREPKRRRSDPMGDSDMNGHQPAENDRGPRCVDCLQIASQTNAYGFALPWEPVVTRPQPCQFRRF